VGADSWTSSGSSSPKQFARTSFASFFITFIAVPCDVLGVPFSQCVEAQPFLLGVKAKAATYLPPDRKWHLREHRHGHCGETQRQRARLQGGRSLVLRHLPGVGRLLLGLRLL